VLALAALLLLSLVLPHVHITGGPQPGNSLLLSAYYFLNASSDDFGPPALSGRLGLGFNVVYLGLGLHQLGLLLSAASFWSLWPDEVNRHIYRLLVIGGWLLAFGAPFVLWGWYLIDTAGVPASLGWAWLPLLVSGISITVAARRAKARIDDTWYSARPELM
jgi:hypothetical protein